jgi:hypothetical protein
MNNAIHKDSTARPAWPMILLGLLMMAGVLLWRLFLCIIVYGIVFQCIQFERGFINGGDRGSRLARAVLRVCTRSGMGSGDRLLRSVVSRLFVTPMDNIQNYPLAIVTRDI